MNNYNFSKHREGYAVYRANTAGVGYVIGNIISSHFVQQSGAIQSAEWFNRSTGLAIVAPILTHLTTIETFEQDQSQDMLNLLTSLVSINGNSDFQNELLLAQFGEASPNPLDVIASIDMRDNAPYDWIMLSANSAVGNAAGLGISVSLDGNTWDDLFNTGNFGVEVRDISGGSVGITTFTANPSQYLFIKPTLRFIRFLDLGGGQSYSFNVFSCKQPPFPETSDPIVNNNLNNIAQSSQFPTLETRDYICLTASTGYSVGDYIRQLVSAFYTNPGNASFVQWQNLTQKTFNLAAPPLGSLTSVEQAQDSQNVTRLVNSNTSVIQIKSTAAYLKSIYVDNLGALTYMNIHQGLVVAPINGASPLESYRIPANGSVSLEFNRVYVGQVYLTFSSTPGAITTSSVNRNVIVSFN